VKGPGGRVEFVGDGASARHRIELSGQERVVLERAARRTAVQDVQRAHTVLYAAQGVSDIEIARSDTSAGLVGC